MGLFAQIGFCALLFSLMLLGIDEFLGTRGRYMMIFFHMRSVPRAKEMARAHV